MVIDDDAAIREFVRDVAEGTGFDVVAVEAFDEFRSSYRSLDPSLVILEAGSREIMLGAVFVNLLLLFPNSNWNRPLLPLCALLYLCLVGIRVGFLPGIYFN